MKLINTSSRYKALGPYSQAVRVENMVYCSGIIGVKEDGSLAESLEDQVHEIFENMKAILGQENLALNHVIKTLVFLSDMNDFAQFNTLYAKEFGEHRPTRSTVQVAALPRQAKVEIEVIASFS